MVPDCRHRLYNNRHLRSRQVLVALRGGCAAASFSFVERAFSQSAEAAVNPQLASTCAPPWWCHSQTRTYSSLAARQMGKAELVLHLGTYSVRTRREPNCTKRQNFFEHTGVTVHREVAHVSKQSDRPTGILEEYRFKSLHLTHLAFHEKQTFLPRFLTNTCQRRCHCCGLKVRNRGDTPKTQTGPVTRGCLRFNAPFSGGSAHPFRTTCWREAGLQLCWIWGDICISRENNLLKD